MLHRTFLRLLALTLIVTLLFLSGCSQKGSQDHPSPTGSNAASVPANPTISANPTIPTDPDTPSTPDTPTGPTHLSGFNHLYDYLSSKGAVTVKEAAYTFSMIANNSKLLLEYKDDTTTITVTLKNDTTTHPVSITFDGYTASAEVDATTYCDARQELNNFRCSTPAIAKSMQAMATTAVWTCFTHAAIAMEPSGVTMASLGFANFEE